MATVTRASIIPDYAKVSNVSVGQPWPYAWNSTSAANIQWQDTTSNATYCSGASVLRALGNLNST